VASIFHISLFESDDNVQYLSHILNGGEEVSRMM